MKELSNWDVAAFFGLAMFSTIYLSQIAKNTAAIVLQLKALRRGDVTNDV